jgi:hypothetical protein
VYARDGARHQRSRELGQGQDGAGWYAAPVTLTYKVEKKKRYPGPDSP